jgi:hypothetical protein
MKQTRNRTVIIKCLSEPNSDCGGPPPFCADSIHYMLETGFEWYGAKRPVSISQINRTLRDLFAAGVIVKESRMCDPIDGGLPSRVNYWQLASEVERNALLHEIRDVLRTASKAHGTFFFGHDHFFDKPMDSAERAAVIADIKSLIQRVHSDKVDGFEYETQQLNKALKYCRSDINLLKTPEKKLTHY